MISKWSDDNACWVVDNVRLYSVLATVVISGEDVWCLANWLVCLSLVLCGIHRWHLLLVVLCGHQCTSAIKWSVRLHLRWGLSVVWLWCAVSRRYIDMCYCNMFSVVNVYLDHLKFWVVCIKARHWSLKKILQKGIIYRYYYIKRLVVTSLEDITRQKNIFFMVAILNNKMASTDRDYSPFYNSVFSVMAEDRSSILFVSCKITSIECNVTR